MDSSTPSLREQGIQALQEGNIDKAVDFLARAVMADDSDAEAKALLGVAYSQKGLHPQAKRALQTAVELQPENANYRFNMGVALERAGDQQGAAIAYRDTLQLNKDHIQARAKLQAMGPEAHKLLANAPKTLGPVGVPTYEKDGTPTAASGGTAAPASYNPALGEGPPGTLQCPSCREWSKPGMVCEFCAGPLPPPAAPVAPMPAYGTGGGVPGSVGGRYISQAPHRGTMILVLGILGFLICGICGIAAWVMGNQDLAAIDSGQMDPSGRGLVQAGRIMGMIATILNIIGAIAYIVIIGMVVAGGGR